MDWANGRVIQMLGASLDARFSVAVFSDPKQKKSYDMEITAHKVYPLPMPFSYAGGVRNFFSFYRIMKQIEKEHDILIIQLPFVGFLSLPFVRKPVVYHMCANVLTAAENPFKYKGVSLLISRSFAYLMHTCFRSLFRTGKTRLIVNGVELGNVYKKYVPQITVSSSILKKEYAQAADIVPRRQEEPFRLLFIGRPSKEKGFPTLLEAFFALVDADKPVQLSLVGMNKIELENLVSKKIDDRYLDRMVFHGFVSWGDEFRQIVKSSHCLIVSSVSEGTPRVVIEARSQGCPVIATRVGGIVTSITHNVDGLLITPNNPGEIVASVNLLFDENVRMQLAYQGLETAKKYSLENFIHEFEVALQSLLPRK